MLKTSTLLVAFVVAWVAGCAKLPSLPSSPEAPKVQLGPNDPLVFREKTPTLITWSLPAGSKVRFGQDGIVIDDGVLVPEGGAFTKMCKGLEGQRVSAREEFRNCAPSKDGLSFSCVNQHKLRACFKYTVTVRDGDKALDPLDPDIHNH